MPNMGQNLSRHNLSLKNKREQPNQTDGSNCQGGIVTCPLNGQCLTDKLVYHSAVTTTSNGSTEHYTGMTENTFKQRHYRDTHSFRHQTSGH